MADLEWQTVRGERFAGLLSRISLTSDQRQDGRGKVARVIRALDDTYWGAPGVHGLLVGSWGKGTTVRPPRDIDILYVLPSHVFTRFAARNGNKQSQLLQEVRYHLSRCFPRTAIGGDGQVVAVPFTSFAVEVVPAFARASGRYRICNTADGGSYRTTDPAAERRHVENSNRRTDGNTRHLIKIAKCWQRCCRVPMKSFWLELLAVGFLDTWPHSGATVDMYDRMVRDFFRYVAKRAEGRITVPGTGETIWIGNEWVSKVEMASRRATNAVASERLGRYEVASDWWERVFGDDVPRVRG